MTDYAAPSIPAVENGTLDPGSLADTVTAEVKRSKEWFGKLLVLHVRDDADNIVYSESRPTPNNDRSALWAIPKTDFKPFLGKQLKAYYTLGEGDALEQSSALVFMVKENFNAPMDVDLSDKDHIVFYDSFLALLPPPDVPAYAQVSRTLSQAVRYESSDPLIAEVDGTGKVSLRGNTSEQPVTITALDDTGKSLGSYALSVRGIRELNLLSTDATLDVAGASRMIAEIASLRLPTAEDFHRFHELYGQAPNGIAQFLGLHGKGLLGEPDNAGNVTFFDLEALAVTRADSTQKGYAVGITAA